MDSSKYPAVVYGPHGVGKTRWCLTQLLHYDGFYFTQDRRFGDAPDYTLFLYLVEVKNPDRPTAEFLFRCLLRSRAFLMENFLSLYRRGTTDEMIHSRKQWLFVQIFSKSPIFKEAYEVVLLDACVNDSLSWATVERVEACVVDEAQVLLDKQKYGAYESSSDAFKQWTILGPIISVIKSQSSPIVSGTGFSFSQIDEVGSGYGDIPHGPRADPNPRAVVLFEGFSSLEKMKTYAFDLGVNLPESCWPRIFRSLRGRYRIFANFVVSLIENRTNLSDPAEVTKAISAYHALQTHFDTIAYPYSFYSMAEKCMESCYSLNKVSKSKVTSEYALTDLKSFLLSYTLGAPQSIFFKKDSAFLIDNGICHMTKVFSFCFLVLWWGLLLQDFFFENLFVFFFAVGFARISSSS